MENCKNNGDTKRSKTFAEIPSKSVCQKILDNAKILAFIRLRGGKGSLCLDDVVCGILTIGLSADKVARSLGLADFYQEYTELVEKLNRRLGRFRNEMVTMPLEKDVSSIVSCVFKNPAENENVDQVFVLLEGVRKELHSDTISSPEALVQRYLNYKHLPPGANKSKLEAVINRCGELRRNLNKRIIGQEYAIDQICSALEETEIFQSEAKGPKCIFTFLGPSGVGKTYLVELLGKLYKGAENIRLPF